MSLLEGVFQLNIHFVSISFSEVEGFCRSMFHDPLASDFLRAFAAVEEE